MAVGILQAALEGRAETQADRDASAARARAAALRESQDAVREVVREEDTGNPFTTRVPEPATAESVQEAFPPAPGSISEGAAETLRVLRGGQ